ncbi:uridylate-specific endoribonuclease C-like [Panulirus ornatus]|uniref:uridylate-specific endoribonuclease C-like n=1 Tax=Panulirus ornatus TaxID=150431 RepID=UPI003A8AC392
MRVVTLLLAVAAVGTYGQSCMGRCGVDDGSSGCQCNSLCSSFGDCCHDYDELCMSCKDRCGEPFSSVKPCQCNHACYSHNDCCQDYADQCEDRVTDADLRALTEMMFAADVNSVGSQLTLDYQGKGNSGDLAPGPLFTSVPDSALNGPTLSLLRKVQDNYEPSVTIAEKQDAAEVAEQNAFLDAITNTQVMHIAEDFLKNNSLLTGNLKDKLNKIWFTMYPRSGNIVGSSGFEHVFVGELKNGKVSGFHNWVRFYTEEDKGTLNYMGWSKVVDLGDKGEINMNHFEWLDKPKSIGSMFVGTSPELDMATYTVCFLTRPNRSCPVQMNGQQFKVQTYTLDYNGMVLVGSSYPDI